MDEFSVGSMNSVEMTVDEATRIIEAISPTVDSERVTGGAKIMITDINGAKEVMVYDGEDGQDGETGPQGPAGPMPVVSVGNVQTGDPGSDVTIIQTGTEANPILNFSIPRGDKGDTGDTGAPGAGVPTGGTTGQLLKKKSGTDYDTEWTDAPNMTVKADKVSGATNGNFAALDSSGNLTDSGHKHSDYITSHQDISGKADKVESATNGNFAALDGYGNLTDSGHKHSDYALSAEVGSVPSGKTVQGQIDELGNSIGTVPSGQTVEGQITALNANITQLDSDLHNGTFEQLTAGNALYLLSDRGDVDVEPYVFRKTGGSKKAYGRELLSKVVGGTVAWNQIVKTANYPTTGDKGDGVSVTTSDATTGEIVITVASGGATANKFFYIGLDREISQNHVVFVCGTQPGDGTGKYGANAFYSGLGKGMWDYGSGCIRKPSGDINQIGLGVFSGCPEGTYKFKPQVFDLTQAFGSAIAEYIITLDNSTAGARVAWFRSLFPNDYYADAGSLQSVQTVGHRTVGFNAFDKDTVKTSAGNYILNDNGEKVSDGTSSYFEELTPVLPSTTYYRYGNISKGSLQRLYFFDGNKNFISRTAGIESDGTFTTPSNCHFLGYQYRRDGLDTSKWCINLSDPSKNGTYEPYQLRSYPLDDIVLRGIPKLDSGNNLYYDGDVYEADGTVTRKYGIVDLGTLNWVFNAISNAFETTDLSAIIKVPANNNTKADIVCSKYANDTNENTYGKVNNQTISCATTGRVRIYDASFASDTSASTVLSGIYLVYALATPTTETADPYRALEVCHKNGTEEFVDAGVTASTPTRDVAIPVGTETKYYVDVFDYIDEKIAELGS